MIIYIKHIIYLLYLLIFLTDTTLHAQTPKKLSLEDCLNLAFDQNSGFNTIKNLELIREQNRKIIQTGLFPEISVSSNISQFVENRTVVFRDDILPISQVNGAGTYGLSSAINSNFNLMNFGKTIKALKTQRYADQVNRWKSVEEKNTIIIMLCKSYFDCVISQELSFVMKEKVKSSELVLDISKLKLEIGELDSLEYYQALINYEQDKNSNLMIDFLFKENLDKLKVLLGIKNTDSFYLDTLILSKNRTDKLPLFYSDSTIRIRSIVNDLKRVKQERNINFFDLIPNMSAFAGYGYSNQTMQNGIVAQNRALGYSYGLNVSYNFGQVKNTIHKRKILQLETDNLNFNLNDQQMISQNRFDLLSLKLNQLNKKNISNDALLDLSAKSLRKVLKSYEMGTVTLTDVRLSQNQYLNTKIENKRTQSDYFICYIELLGLSNSLQDVIISNLKQR